MLDITGATLVDADVALRLKRLFDAAELLGAEGMLVGMTSAMARAAIESGVEFGRVRSFATLKDGLRATIQAKRKQKRG
jgi:rsbT co-antagonist protein RsbR